MITYAFTLDFVCPTVFRDLVTAFVIFRLWNGFPSATVLNAVRVSLGTAAIQCAPFRIVSRVRLAATTHVCFRVNGLGSTACISIWFAIAQFSCTTKLFGIIVCFSSAASDCSACLRECLSRAAQLLYEVVGFSATARCVDVRLFPNLTGTTHLVDVVVGIVATTRSVTVHVLVNSLSLTTDMRVWIVAFVATATVEVVFLVFDDGVVVTTEVFVCTVRRVAAAYVIGATVEFQSHPTATDLFGGVVYAITTAFFVPRGEPDHISSAASLLKYIVAFRAADTIVSEERS